MQESDNSFTSAATESLSNESMIVSLKIPTMEIDCDKNYFLDEETGLLVELQEG